MHTLSHVKEFARTIVPNGQLLHVEHRPESGAVLGECFRNVTEKMKRDGGTSQMGWMFQSGKGFLTAVHHCVLCDPSGQLIDITPLGKDAVVVDGKVVFLADNSATLIRPPGFEIGLAKANRVYVYSNKADIVLVSKLMRKEREWEVELAAIQEIERAAELAQEHLVREASQRGGCGGCRACCIAMGVKELGKETWEPCKHLSATGCAIYSDRPNSCEGFYCSYLSGDTPADLKYRPDNLGILICMEWGQTVDGLTGSPIVVCYEIHPGAFAANSWVKPLADRIARQHECLNVWWYPHNQPFCKWEELGIKDTPVK